ncbi:protein toll [Ceratitis capitata]|uniref:(Mediterranean fruit fly) hypothetical protein n=1 Tax=Ceratitis capitata TaxID=7213 RepID=A0A811UA72_CERCA|nr:protein toll [Ceratitis capitata]CAD6994223.1 unnamed protein product [Ceratitis capitata]
MNFKGLANFKMCRWVNKMLILILILGLQQAQNSAVFTETDCKVMSADSNCQCFMELARYKIECVLHESQGKLNIRITPGKVAKIECEDFNEESYKMLPKLNIGPMKIAQIQHCPLPDDEQSIVELFKRLGIERVNYLAYTIDAGNTNITHQQLSGMEQLRNLKLNAKTEIILPNDLFQHLPNLIWLNLCSNNFTLEEHLLEPLVNLTYLDLGHNFLVDLPAGIFKNQGKLRQLNLWNNRLRKLTKQAFQGAHELSFLDLSSNEIEHLEHDVFARLVSLKSLNLNMNKLVDLPPDLFASNKLLKEFRLINNKVQLKTLPRGLFENLTQLEEVTVTCGLVDLQEDLFDGCTKLANLTLRNNELTTLPDKLLSHQKNLYNVDLSHNRLQSLPDKLFQSTVGLVVLKLSHNQLVEITSELFKPLTKLEILQLNDNDLLKIDFNAFTETSNMKYLNLANNQIDLSMNAEADVLEIMDTNDNNDGYVEDFPNDDTSPFRFLFNLEELYLRNNSIMSLYKDWRIQLLKLRKLDLSYNKINTFSTQDIRFFSNEVALVNLTHNLIEQINFNGINNIELHTAARPIHFDFNENPLNCDCGILHFVQFIIGDLAGEVVDKIEVSTNNLRCVGPPALKDKEVIDLSTMELVCPLDDQFSLEKLCPQGCECLVRPVDLMLLINCSYGNFTEVPKLPALTLLKGIELNVAHNQIKNLPNNTTPGYSSVVALFAADNQLHHIKADNLPENLEYLDLRNNLLQTLDKDVLIYFFNNCGNLQSIFLANNPWVCDCLDTQFLGSIQALFDTGKITEHDLLAMRCVMKIDSIGVQFGSLTVVNVISRMICLSAKYLKLGLLFFIAFLLMYVILRKHCENEDHDYCPCMIERNVYPNLLEAFIIYSKLDEHFFTEPTEFKNTRDLNPPKKRPDNIVVKDIKQYAKKSKRTVILLSENFVKDIWAVKKYRSALQNFIPKIIDRVIIILYGIKCTKSLDSVMMKCFKGATFYVWGEPNFWDQMRAELPQIADKKAIDKYMVKLEVREL